MARISLRLDEELQSLLDAGRRRTPLKKQELIRRTLRAYLAEVIERESKSTNARLTRVAPWPRGTLAKAYRRLARIEKEWEPVEDAAVRAEGRPSWDD